MGWSEGGAPARNGTQSGSTHGWHLDEQGMFAKCTLFEAATRAPMMVAVPGVTEAGHRSTQLTEHVDLLPTLAAAAGLAVPAQCPLDGGTTSPQPALCTEGVNALSLLPAVRRAGGEEARGAGTRSTTAAASALAPSA